MIQQGDTARFTKTITETDVYLFAGVTGDLNPLHVDAVHASSTCFGERIAHGMLSASLICTVLGTKLPGPGTIHLHQDLHFRAPVRFGDTLTAEVRVLDISVTEKRARITLETVVSNQDATVVVEGTAVVKPPRDRVAPYPMSSDPEIT